MFIRQQIEYIQKYLNINIDNLMANAEIIDDLIFYRNKERGYDNDLPIYDILNCEPIRIQQFPDNKKFAVCLTHDIDDIYPPLSHDIASFLYNIKNFRFGDIAREAKLFKRKEDSIYYNFDKIMRIEEDYGSTSSFYFIATSEDIRRFRYNIEDLDGTLGEIVDKGWEVGLHGGYYSYNSLERIINEKKRVEKVLNKNIVGYRNHYLRFDVPNTWKFLMQAGFKYDSTFGYANNIGFRNGMCHPFKPFDVIDNREIDIIEIPLNIMEQALFSSDIESAWNRIKNIIDNVEKHNGVITILWHNYIFGCNFREKWAKLYEKLLKYCKDKNAWMTNGAEISKWWLDGC